LRGQVAAKLRVPLEQRSALRTAREVRFDTLFWQPNSAYESITNL
jgi:hypothetical protein